MAAEDGRVGLEGCRRRGSRANVWRADGVVSPSPHSYTPGFVFAQRAVANFEAGARMLAAVSSETGIPDGPVALDETDGGDPKARSGRRKHAGAN